MSGYSRRLAVLALAVSATLAVPTACFAQGDPLYGPSVFNRALPSGIGAARQHYDRQTYDSYRGDPGAQFELRQKRQNLCRNVPEMC